MTIKSPFACGAVLLYRGHFGIVHQNANRSRSHGFYMTTHVPSILDFFDDSTGNIVFSFGSGLAEIVDLCTESISSFYTKPIESAKFSGLECRSRFLSLAIDSGICEFYCYIDDGISPPLRDRTELHWRRRGVAFAYAGPAATEWEVNMVQGAMAAGCTLDELNTLIMDFRIFSPTQPVEWMPVDLLMDSMKAASKYKGEERREVLARSIAQAVDEYNKALTPAKAPPMKQKPKVGAKVKSKARKRSPSKKGS